MSEGIGTIFEFIEQITSLFEEFNSGITSITTILSLISQLFGIFVSIGSFIVSTVSLVGAIIAAVVSIAFAIIWYFFQAIPAFVLAKKNSRKLAWLAFIPIIGFYDFVLCDIAAGKDFTLFGGKLRVKNRYIVFWVYLGVALLASAIVSILSTVLTFIPGANILSPIIRILPSIFCAFVSYAFLRDVFDTYREDKKLNVTIAIIATAVDYILPVDGLATAICLYCILKRKPLEEKPEDSELAQEFNSEEPLQLSTTDTSDTIEIIEEKNAEEIV